MSSDRKLRQIAAALRRLEQIELSECFDPFKPETRPTPKQEQIFRDFGKVPIQIIRAGNQCLAKGTLVATPRGPIEIENIKVGDEVFDHNGNIIKVLKTFSNGKKPVVKLINRNRVWAECTEDHVFLTNQGEKAVKDFKQSTRIKRLVFEDKGVSTTSIGVKVIPSGIKETYDIHVDSPENLYLLANGLVTHNSGKTSTVSRICAWLLKENHPYWTRPKEWANEPLLMIVCGRTGKQIEESLLRRITAFFPEGELKEVRIGNQIQKIVHRDTGNTIIFQSYENINQARERVQSYTAHFVWVDEMPSSFALFDELMRRVQAKSGYFAATFTPLIINADIRKFCDTLEERNLGKVYRLHMFDNPIYADPVKQEKILAEMATLPEHVRKSRLEGDWMMPENSVYYFDTETMVRDLPPYYSHSWRHIEISDPALDSAHGLVVLAEDPNNGQWYTVIAEYVTGIHVPEHLVNYVLERTRPYNIVRRVADGASTWYIHTANSKGVHYMIPHDKNNRRDDMIKGVQSALGRILFVTPYCVDLIDEFQNYRWSESADGKIVKSSRFHLLDALRYGVDCLPKFDRPIPEGTWAHQVMQNHYRIKKKEELEKKMRGLGRKIIVGVRGRRWL